jgi:hypothetical protein
MAHLKWLRAFNFNLHQLQVIYIDDSYSVGHGTTQVVIFRKVEVIKGRVDGELLKIGFFFGFGSPWVTETDGKYRLAASTFSSGKKLIIFFIGK